MSRRIRGNELNTLSELAELSRENIDKLTVVIARAGEAARPAVRVVQVNDYELVIKDYATGDSRFKRLMGRYLVAREKVAYRRLQGVPGIPKYYGTLDSYTLVLQRIQAHPVLEVPSEQLPGNFLATLADLVRDLHCRGVAHGDLEKHTNVLVDQDGQPILVDFAASIMTGSNPLAALLFPLLCDNDWRGVYKLTERIAPHLLTRQQEQFLHHRSRIERLFRRCRQPLRYLIKRWAHDR